MESLKRACDVEALRGTRRMAMGGFGILIVYWGAVARLAFWDYGWDVGLSMVTLSYLWYAFTPPLYVRSGRADVFPRPGSYIADERCRTL